MDWNNGYIAVDWGTTNRRAYLVDRGHITGSIEDERGILAMTQSDFANSVAELRAVFGDRPMLLAGMVGSNRGWRETPYVPCPANVATIGRGIGWIDAGRTGIVPGVAQLGGRPDVMRGEETQAIGAATLSPADNDGLFCHPGTHSKWVTMDGGTIASLRTAMTGELFALISQRSILADQLGGRAHANTDFRAAARRGLEGADPGSELFVIRARALLGQGELDAPSYASGLLIGAELRAALATAPDRSVTIVGRTDLCDLYSAALEEAGRRSHCIDGTDAFLAGIAAIVETFA